MSLNKEDTVLSGVLEKLNQAATDLFICSAVMAKNDRAGKAPNRNQLKRLKFLAKEVNRHAEVLP